MILEDGLRDGDPLPSVRALAADMQANPLTVAKAYSTLQDTRIIEARRGIGFFLAADGKARLKESERLKFMTDEWPAITREMKMLDLNPALLLRSASTSAKR